MKRLMNHNEDGAFPQRHLAAEYDLRKRLCDDAFSPIDDLSSSLDGFAISENQTGPGIGKQVRAASVIRFVNKAKVYRSLFSEWALNEALDPPVLWVAATKRLIRKRLQSGSQICRNTVPCGLLLKLICTVEKVIVQRSTGNLEEVKDVWMIQIDRVVNDRSPVDSLIRYVLHSVRKVMSHPCHSDSRQFRREGLNVRTPVGPMG